MSRIPELLLTSDPEVGHQAAAIADDWAQAGLAGAFLASNLDTGAHLGFNVDRPIPIASIVKLPIALVVLDEIDHGRLDPGSPVLLDPAWTTPGPTGTARFRHPSRIAVEDLVQLMLALSDNAAADALLDLVPAATVARRMVEWGFSSIVVRHTMRDLYDAVDAVAADPEIGMQLAVRGRSADGGHPIATLDGASANVATARSLVDLLSCVWRAEIATPTVTTQLRDLLGEQIFRQRLGAEIASDSVRVFSKTGTFLNLRHEAGVVTTDLGDRIAIAALTESRVVSRVQPEADAAIGRAARIALETLRT